MNTTSRSNAVKRSEKQSGEKKHIIAAFSIALFIAFLLVVYLILALHQAWENERFLDALRHKQRLESYSGNNNNNTNNLIK